MTPTYEVVSGQILLSARKRFFELHSSCLLPIMKKIGIRPILLLITEVGRYGSFLDIYIYKDLAQYERLTDELIRDPKIEAYYEAVGACIIGSISVELMTELPYAQEWT